MIQFAFSHTLFCLLLVPSGWGAGNAEYSPNKIEDEWILHKDGNLSVKLPFKPKVQTQKVKTPLGDLEIKIYMCEISRKKAFLVSRASYPVSPSRYNVKEGLKGAVQGMAKESKGKIESEKSIKMGTIPGKEVVLSTGSELLAKSRIFIDGNGPTLYQFQAVGEKSFLDEQVVKDFMKSIEIKPLPPSDKGDEEDEEDDDKKEPLEN